MADGLGEAMTGTYETPAGTVGTAPRKQSKPKVTRMEIELADNGGFMVTCYHRQPERVGKPSPYIEPTKSAFEDVGSMLEYVEKKLGAGNADAD